jgi:hypothetical protein
MIIVRSYDEISGVTREIVDAGYGYSVLSDPDPRSIFDLESVKEMFSDWGWAAEVERKPPWMKPTAAVTASITNQIATIATAMLEDQVDLLEGSCTAS